MKILFHCWFKLGKVDRLLWLDVYQPWHTASSRWPRHKSMVMKWMITGPRQEVWKFGLSFDGGFINNMKTSKAMRISHFSVLFVWDQHMSWPEVSRTSDTYPYSVFTNQHCWWPFPGYSSSVSESQDTNRGHSNVDRSLTVNHHFNQLCWYQSMSMSMSMPQYHSQCFISPIKSPHSSDPLCKSLHVFWFTIYCCEDQ